ncbi:MAG: energy-coupling factor transporter transmembrane protein EcfT [Rhodobacteraceae bacterium]|nr:energy-coupling factor transporter transmembrane protein EcfT [Paracoccaceae bacterium]
MMSLYVPGQSWLHRCPAGVKFVLLCVISAVLLAMHDLWLLGLAFVATLMLYASLGPQGVRQVSALKPLAFLLVILFLFHLMTGDWQQGLRLILHLGSMVLLANLVTITTRLDDMMAALRPIFQPIRFLGLSPSVPALAVALVIRFVPELLRVYNALAEAYRAKTGARGSYRLIAPFMIQALAMSENVAEALSARGGASGFEPAGSARDKNAVGGAAMKEEIPS